MMAQMRRHSRKTALGFTTCRFAGFALLAAAALAAVAAAVPAGAGTVQEAVVNAAGEVNDITLRRSGPEVQVLVNGILDPEHAYDFGSLRSIQVNGVRGDNTLTVDFRPGNPIPHGGLAFDCSRGIDTLVVNGHSMESVTYNATGPGAGRLDLDGSLISFSGLEPVTITTPSVGVVNVEVTDGLGHEIVLQNGPGLGRLLVTIDGGLEDMVFPSPDDLLNINAGPGHDRITVHNLDPAFTADILIDGGTGEDTFSVLPRLGGGYTFVSGGDPAQGDLGVPPGDVLALDLDNVPDAQVHGGAAEGWVSSVTHGIVQWEGIEEVVVPDRYELNESVAQATVLGSVPVLTLSDLSISPRIDAPPEPGSADIVLVVDESTGMSHGFIQDLVPGIEAALTAVGVGIGSPTRFNRYGLVGFGGANDPVHLRGHSHLVGGDLFGTATELVVAAGTLVLTGDTEDGYDGVDFALDNYPFREDALRMVILVTDEDRDVVNGSLNFAGVAAALAASGTTLHAILNVDLENGGGAPALAVAGDGAAYQDDGDGGVVESTGGVATGGFGNTIADYVNLVFAGSGLVGDLNEVEAGGDTAESFASALQINLGGSLSVVSLPPDVDVFAYTSPVNGRLEVRALFEDDVGNLDLRVLDIFENVVAAASVMTDAERAVLPVAAGETYYLEVSGAAGAVNNYTLEIETFGAPVPDAVVLDPTDDTGWSIWDNITAEPEARIFIEADLYAFADAGIDILSPAEVSAQEPGAAVAVSVNGGFVGYADPIPGTGNTLFQYFFEPSELSTTFMPVGSGGGENLVKAAVEVFDGQGDAGGDPDPASGRTLLSEPLIIVLDMTAPDPPTPDLQASSDDGDSDTDNFTSVHSPTFQGVAEDRALLTLTAHAGATLLGTAAVGDDDSDAVPNNGLGAWYLTVGPLNAGVYDVTASVEDPAGNTSGSSPPLEVTIFGPATANPAAKAGGLYFVPRGRKLILDGSESFDPDEINGDAIVSWDWDLNRDHIFGDVSGEMVTLPWSQVRSMVCLGSCRAGPDRRYRVRLQVEDTLGLLGRDTAFVEIVRPLVRDKFHPKDWPSAVDRWSFSGRWANRSGRLVASQRKNNKAIAKMSPVRAGVLLVDLWLDPVKFDVEPNAALIFGRVGPSRYRFVNVTPTGVSIGQSGNLGSESPGIKAAAAMAVPTDTKINLRVDVHPGGWVLVYLDGSAIPVISHQFDKVVRGGVGLLAKKARSTFDNFYLLPKRMLR